MQEVNSKISFDVTTNNLLVSTGRKTYVYRGISHNLVDILYIKPHLRFQKEKLISVMYWGKEGFVTKKIHDNLFECESITDPWISCTEATRYSAIESWCYLVNSKPDEKMNNNKDKILFGYLI